MRLIIYTLLTLLCFQSCLQHKEASKQAFTLLKNCNQVNMIYYNHNDTLTYKTKDTLEIGALTELISGKNDAVGDSCVPSGKLVYESNGQIILTAEFSTTATNEDVDCNYVVVYKSIHKIYKHKLNNRTGMFIHDILWHILRWSSVYDHGPIRLHGDTGNVVNNHFTKALQKPKSDSTK